MSPFHRTGLALLLLFPFALETSAAPSQRPSATAQATVTIRSGIAVRSGEVTPAAGAPPPLPHRRVERPCTDGKGRPVRCVLILVEMP